MGKANRVKTEKAENVLSSSTYKRKHKKSMPTWLGTTIIVTVLVLLLLTAAFFAMSSAGVFNRMRVVMATDNYKVTVPMMSYLVYSEYQSQVATYDSYSEQWGITVNIPSGKGGDQLDKNKPLRDQIYARQDENGLELATPETWFDHYASLALEKLTQMLVVCEAANAAGVKLEDGDMESIDMAVDYLAVYASAYGYTTNGYIAAMYGQGVNKRDVRNMMKISALSDKYNKQRSEEFTNGVTDDQVLAEYNGNVSKYDVYVDYIGYTFTASFTASTNTVAETAKTENEANAAKYEAKKAKYRALLAELETAAKENPATYSETLLKVLKELFYDEAVEAELAKKAEGATLTEAEDAACRTSADKKAADAVANAIYKNVDTSGSSIDTEFKAWVTDKNTPRKSGDIYTKVKNYDAFNKLVTESEDKPEGETEESTAAKDYEDASSTYTIYLMTSGLKRNDGVLRSVGHILFKTETFQDSKTGEALTTSESFSGAMKVLADRVLAKHGYLSAELMSAELLALMLEEGKLVAKTVDGKTYYEMDPAVFEAYGNQYTGDSNVFYDNVKQGQMVKSFENWMFDSSRVMGEVSYPSAIESDYGYHIMIYRGDQKDAWSYEIRVSLAEGQYDAWLENLLKTTTIVKNNTHNLAYIAG